MLHFRFVHVEINAIQCLHVCFLTAADIIAAIVAVVVGQVLVLNAMHNERR